MRYSLSICILGSNMLGSNKIKRGIQNDPRLAGRKGTPNQAGC